MRMRSEKERRKLTNKHQPYGIPLDKRVESTSNEENEWLEVGGMVEVNALSQKPEFHEVWWIANVEEMRGKTVTVRYLDNNPPYRGGTSVCRVWQVRPIAPSWVFQGFLDGAKIEVQRGFAWWPACFIRYVSQKVCKVVFQNSEDEMVVSVNDIRPRSKWVQNNWMLAAQDEPVDCVGQLLLQKNLCTTTFKGSTERSVEMSFNNESGSKDEVIDNGINEKSSLSSKISRTPKHTSCSERNSAITRYPSSNANGHTMSKNRDAKFSILLQSLQDGNVLISEILGLGEGSVSCTSAAVPRMNLFAYQCLLTSMYHRGTLKKDNYEHVEEFRKCLNIDNVAHMLILKELGVTNYPL